MIELFRIVDYTFGVNVIEDIDTENQRITLGLTMRVQWQDTRISCAKCGAAEVRNNKLHLTMISRNLLYVLFLRQYGDQTAVYLG